MAGIAAFFARESVPDYKFIMEPMLNSYLSFQDKHVIDAVIIKPNGEVVEWDYTIINGNVDELNDNFQLFYYENIRIHDLIIFSVDINLNYDKENRFILTNDSSNVRTFTKRSYSCDKYLMDLYVEQQRDMKRSLESCEQCDINLIACDLNKMNLMTANDGHQGLQMCHAYVKGVGFMLHENMVCLRNIIHKFTDCSQDAVNLWETWYGHPLESEVIRETDLESGSMRKIKFNPKWSY